MSVFVSRQLRKDERTRLENEVGQKLGRQARQWGCTAFMWHKLKVL